MTASGQPNILDTGALWLLAPVVCTVLVRGSIVTSQKDQIQTLIAEIDQVLQKASPRLPWVMSGDAAQQRRVLERVRAYLVSLQKTVAEDNLRQARTRQNLSAYDIQYQPNQGSHPAPAPLRGDLSQQDTARQILQVVAQEIDGLRANLMQPLQSDIEALRQQRDSLTQEIRQLESQRHHYSLAQQQANQQQIISEFLQILMVRLQDSLAQQVAQTLSTSDSQALIGHGGASALGSLSSGALDQAQRLEQLQTLQARSDQLLINLDSTLRVVFEALQRNVKSYQESLSQGLERMHDLGQQGEVMFTALVNHLAQQLGREASSYLQSSLQLPSLEATAKSSVPNLSPPVAEPEPLSDISDIEVPSTEQHSPTEPPPAFSNVNADLGLPYPGAELPLEPTGAEIPAEDLEELNLEDLDLSNLNLSEDEPDAEIGSLLNLDLSDLDLEVSEDLASGFSSSSDTSNPAFAISDLGLSSPVTPSTPAAKGETSEISSEFDFLQQLSVDPEAEFSGLATGESAREVAPSRSTDDLTDDLAELEPAPDQQAEPPHDELDEFYASLFGPTPGDEAPFDSVEVVTDLEAVVPATLVDEVEFADAAQQDDSMLASSTLPAENSAIAPIVEDLTAIAPAVEDALFGDFESTAEPESTPSASGSININEINAEPLESIDELLFSSRPELPDADLVNDFSADLNALDGRTSYFDAQPVEEPRESSRSSEIVEDLDATGFATLENAFVEDWQSSPAETTSSQQLENISSPDLAALDLPEPVVDLSFNDFQSPDVAANSADDSYIPAAPEESLLASQESTETPEANLWVDEDVFQQLHEDLFSLEGIESDRAANLDDTDFTLAAFEHELNQENAPSPPPPADINEDLNSLTLEDFAETLPEPEVRPNAPEDLNFPSDESSPTEEPKFDRSREGAAADVMMLDSFDDLFAEIPFEETPAASDAFPPEPSAQPAETKLTGVDTQSMTLEDAFGSFVAEDPESDDSDLGDSLAQLEDWNFDQNEKKKI